MEIPSSLYRLSNLRELSLDWFSYLNAEYVSIHTKHLKAHPDPAKSTREEQSEAAHHQRVISKFLDMCKFVQICEIKKQLEKRTQVMHNNP